jgi:hypothetical protein
MTFTCAKCGKTVNEEPSLKFGHSDTLKFCPKCYGKRHAVFSDSFIAACSILLLAGVLLAVFKHEFLIFQAGLLALFLPLSVITHELGHAIAALLLKAKVLRIHIGCGKFLNDFNFCGIEWKFYSLPVSGCVYTCILNRKFYRIRSFLISLCGPVLNLIIALTALIMLFLISSYWFSVFIKPFIAVNIYSFVYSLLPTERLVDGKEVPTDGFILLTVPFMSNAKIDKEIESNYAWCRWMLFKGGRIEEAGKILKKGLTLFPESNAIYNEIARLNLQNS